MKISIKKDERNGFDRILALLNQLIDTTTSTIKDYTSQAKTISLNCTVTNASLTQNQQNLLSMRNNYTTELKNLGSLKKINKIIANLTSQRSLLKKERKLYVGSYTKINSNFLKFKTLVQKALKEAGNVYTDVSRLYRFSLKTKLKADQKSMAEMSKEDAKYAYVRLKDLLVEIGQLDDTPLCLFREQLQKNIKRWAPTSDNYLVASNSSLEINATLTNFANYYSNKMNNFTNANKTIFTYDTKISSLTALISNYKYNHKKNYEILKNNLVALIALNNQSIASSTTLLTLVKQQCVENIQSLSNKITITNSQFKSYTKLKLYFMNNYHIAASMKKKYHGNINVKSLKNATAAKLKK
jgi:hypothetical protein